MRDVVGILIMFLVVGCVVMITTSSPERPVKYERPDDWCERLKTFDRVECNTRENATHLETLMDRDWET